MAKAAKTPKKEEKKAVTVCRDGCRYYVNALQSGARDPVCIHQCRAPKAPITGLVLGLKECININHGNSRTTRN